MASGLTKLGRTKLDSVLVTDLCRAGVLNAAGGNGEIPWTR